MGLTTLTFKARVDETKTPKHRKATRTHLLCGQDVKDPPAGPGAAELRTDTQAVNKRQGKQR